MLSTKRRESLSVDEVMSLRPCVDYPRNVVEGLFAGRERLTFDDFLNLGIPDSGKIWVGLKMFSEKEQHQLACIFAERALKSERRAGREPDKRSWDGIRIKRLWIDGKASGADLDAAYVAAASAALVAAALAADTADAGTYAAYAATYAADTADAGTYAAYAAYVAYVAADTAATAAKAAYAAERKNQIAILKFAWHYGR